jgi:hypothetical protein
MSRLSTLYRPGWPIVLKYCLASFQADSTASEPEVGELRRLARGRLGHLAAAVPDLAHEQPGQAVQVALAAVVVDVLPRPPDDHGHVAFGIGRHAGEVQPQVAVRGRLQVALRSCLRGPAAGIAGAVRSTHLVPQL